MIYLVGFEPSVITIKYNYGKGTMRINVSTFMETSTLTKIKKLIDLIRNSETPDVESTIKQYCNEWLELYEREQKANANGHVNSKDNYKNLEKQLFCLQNEREKFKKGTRAYKELSQKVKNMREQVNFEKRKSKNFLNNFKENERLKVKYEKILEYIS